MTRHITAAMLAAATAFAAHAGAADKGAAASTTITGCLRVDGTRYVLSDAGDTAPKARNWKTAFVTRSTRTIEIVGAPTSARLNQHVGRKVMLVGTRTDAGHFKLQAVKQVWQVSSCS